LASVVDRVKEYVPKEFAKRRFPVKPAIDQEPRVFSPGGFIHALDSFVQGRILLLECRQEGFRIGWRGLRQPVHQPVVDQFATSPSLAGKRPNDLRR
jgi:hypothetical protein